MHRIGRKNMYDYLKSEPAPRILVEAVKLLGTKEVAGKEHNPVILDWAKELKISWYKEDETPWCGLFMGIVAKRAGKDLPANILSAISWATFGTERQTAMLGDVLVFKREGGNHVGLYVGEDKDCYHVLGGNQSDSVKVSRIAKNRCIAIRRCAWKTAQPANIRVIHLDAKGEISKNEK